jgi:hypothetical protein
MKRRLRAMILRRLLPPLDESTNRSLARAFFLDPPSTPELESYDLVHAMPRGVLSVYEDIRDGRIS